MYPRITKGGGVIRKLDSTVGVVYEVFCLCRREYKDSYARKERS